MTVTVFSQQRDGSQKVELPGATGISYEFVLNQPGSCSFQLPAMRFPDHAGARTIPMSQYLRPGEHEIGVRRHGAVVWLGPLVPMNGAEILQGGDTGTFQFQAQGLPYYPFRWTVDAKLPDTNADGHFVDVDQATIVQALIDHHQAKGGGDFHLDTSAITATGEPRTRREYDAWRRVNIGEAIQQLAEIEGGFDWQVRAVDRQVLVHFPRRGVRRKDVSFNPANLRALARSVSYDDQASRVRGFGDGFDADTLQFSAQDSTAVATYGLTETSWGGSNISDQDVLASHVNQELRRVAVPPMGITLRVRFGDNLPYGSFEVGDEVKVEVPASAYEPIDEWRRVIAVKHMPASAESLEEADVTTVPVGV